MTAIRYYRDKCGWDSETVLAPDWSTLEAAIRRMDDYCYPVVQLNLTDNEEDESIFNIVGGSVAWPLFHTMGEWQFEDPAGGDAEVQLWQSDQGYFCRENILADIDDVLRVTRVFYETGSYEALARASADVLTKGQRRPTRPL